MSTKVLQRVGANSIAIIASVIMVIPVYLIVTNSFKDSVQSSSMGLDLPVAIHLENFTTVIDKGKLATSFFNSMLYACTATFVGTLVSAMAAYVLSRNRTRINRLLYLFLIMGIAVPINYFTLTKVMQITHLINTKLGITILYAAFQIPLGVFLIYGFVESIPRELDEAAVIDGCGPIQLFTKIILPLLTPVLVTAGLLGFLSSWNEFLLPLYFLNNTDNWPMTLAVYNFFGQFRQSWNLVSADILLTIIPVVVIYLFGQRFILSGLTTGAVKG
jgi:raffinose/stachyose/melibiose transport system permease protein